MPGKQPLYLQLAELIEKKNIIKRICPWHLHSLGAGTMRVIRGQPDDCPQSHQPFGRKRTSVEDTGKRYHCPSHSVGNSH